MQQDNAMTEEESLSIITGMINRAKNRFSETGTLYLLWGWVIFICCMTQFIMLHFFNNDDAYYIWYLTWLAVIYQMYYLARKKRKETVKTYTDEIIGFVWLTFMICAFLIVYILSGIILKFKALSIGGCICWLLSIVAMFTDYEYQLLLLSLAVISAWMIPGYLLRAKFKKEN